MLCTLKVMNYDLCAVIYHGYGGTWFGIGQMDKWIRLRSKEPNAWIHFNILHNK